MSEAGSNDLIFSQDRLRGLRLPSIDLLSRLCEAHTCICGTKVSEVICLFLLSLYSVCISIGESYWKIGSIPTTYLHYRIAEKKRKAIFITSHSRSGNWITFFAFLFFAPANLKSKQFSWITPLRCCCYCRPESYIRNRLQNCSAIPVHTPHVRSITIACYIRTYRTTSIETQCSTFRRLSSICLHHVTVTITTSCTMCTPLHFFHWAKVYLDQTIVRIGEHVHACMRSKGWSIHILRPVNPWLKRIGQKGGNTTHSMCMRSNN